MKLYTERQMKEMFRMGLAHSINEDGALGQFSPIELPSDEEIKDASIKYYVNKSACFYFEIGAKWMRDKIKLGNK
jgi:hypothetical protein